VCMYERIKHLVLYFRIWRQYVRHRALPRVNQYPLLDYALCDEELLVKIEETVRAAGGNITRGPR
jgi:hypothetical protein